MPKEMYQSLWMEISEAEERAQRDMMDSDHAETEERTE